MAKKSKTGSKVKLYGYDGGATANEAYRLAMVIDEDGVEVVRTRSEDERSMPKDVGAIGNAYHDLYNEQYGVDGWELEFVPSTATTNAGLVAALSNKAKLDEKKESK